MRTGWRATLLAAGVALALTTSGVALAKPHDDHGKGYGHGRGEEHGKGGGEQGKGKGNGGGNAACDPAVVETLRAAIDAACPCAGTDDGSGGVTPWKNHGRYVRCIAHAVRAEARQAGLKRRCLRGAVPCAARSACGKRGAAPCVTPIPDACVGGFCTDDPARPCALDADCTSLACDVTDPDECTGGGGAVRSSSCCFGSPSGAFVDAATPF